MIISSQAVAKVADLARITKEPSQDFLDKYTKELSSIIEYINQLQEVNTSGITPNDGVRTITIKDLREDCVTNDSKSYQRIRNNIINNFPSRQGDLLILPSIFEER